MEYPLVILQDRKMRHNFAPCLTKNRTATYPNIHSPAYYYPKKIYRKKFFIKFAYIIRFPKLSEAMPGTTD